MADNIIYKTLDDLPPMLTVSELGSILRVGRNTAYELLRCGEIPSKRIKGQLRVPKQAVIDYIFDVA